MDISMFRKSVIVRVLDVLENYSDKRPGYNRVDCELESGDKTFIVLSKEETDAVPAKDGYADLSSVARIRTWLKGGKSGQYLERINPLPATNAASTSTKAWSNPWAKK